MSRFFILWIGCMAVSLAVFVPCLIRKMASVRSKRPAFTNADIVYQEWMASGNSQANLLTKMGGASRCLRLIVTKDYLIVTSWFPFNLFTAFYDLEHSIPLKAIESIRQRRILVGSVLDIKYQDDAGRNHAVTVAPQNRDKFLKAMRRPEPTTTR